MVRSATKKDVSEAKSKNIILVSAEEYDWLLKKWGHGADASDLAAVLALVPDAEPEDDDRFPAAPTPQ